MLPRSKTTEIFFVIDEFSQVFNATIKEKSLSDGKSHRNKPYKMSESKVATILVYFIQVVIDVCSASLRSEVPSLPNAASHYASTLNIFSPFFSHNILSCVLDKPI